MLELAILGLLKERAMHGYELKRQLGQRLGFFWTVSFGSLYPTLKKLETKELVERVNDGDGRPRRRQVYRITDTGEDEFLTLIGQGSTSAWEEEKFPLRFAFFRYLNADTRIWLLQRRHDYLTERLMQARTGYTRAKRGRADPYTLSLMRHGVETTEHDLNWIEELLAVERSAARDPDDQLPTEDTAPDPTLGDRPLAGTPSDRITHLDPHDTSSRVRRTPPTMENTQ